MSVHDDLGDEFDESLDARDLDDDFDDEIAAEGNRIGGARARAVTEFLARELVEDVDAVDVTMSEARGEVSLLIHASQPDVGRLIGRRGRVIQAVRQVARAAGAIDGTRVGVEVAD
ncbi:MAG: hypothetical protein AMXMBFR46_18190 [Acidimicrobiia bacterium]